MINLRRIAILGNHLPRQCGIATFTHDLHAAVRAARPALDTAVVAITGAGTSHDYPPCVNFEIRENVLGDYSRSAISMAATDTDLVCLQHEYGIFGGIAGSHILEFLDHSTIPVVTTLHTVLAEPTLAQRRTIERVIDRSTKLIVMADRARALLQTVHNVPDSKIEVIPHGIHDRPLCSPDDGKTALGYEGKKVILTFGLLSPNKGIETMLDAMPRILQASPGAVYIVLGATHPSLLREHGEAYRDLLLAHAQTLGIENHVVFVNQFVDQATLLDYIAMCDVYVTPYANEAQMTSGTLAYSFGMGASVVSTPYWHATELLRDNLGILVPFADAETMGRENPGCPVTLNPASLRIPPPKPQIVTLIPSSIPRTPPLFSACIRTPCPVSVLSTGHSDRTRQDNRCKSSAKARSGSPRRPSMLLGGAGSRQHG